MPLEPFGLPFSLKELFGKGGMRRPRAFALPPPVFWHLQSIRHVSSFFLFCRRKTARHRRQSTFLYHLRLFSTHFWKYDHFVTSHLYNRIIPKQKYAKKSKK